MPSATRKNPLLFQSSEVNRPCQIQIQNTNCNRCCPQIAWVKLAVTLSLVTYYYLSKDKKKKYNRLEDDLGSYIFLLTTAVWLSVMNLEPRCLRCFRPFKWMYDVFAVTIFSDIILDTVWVQIKKFLSIMTELVYKYLEKTYLAENLYDWLDPEGSMNCISVVVATLYALWVIYSFCIFEAAFCFINRICFVLSCL